MFKKLWSVITNYYAKAIKEVCEIAYNREDKII